MTKNKILIDEFLEEIRKKEINKNTYEAYKQDLTTLEEYLGEKNILLQDRDFVSDYIIYLKSNFGESSVYRKIASLKLFYKKLFELGKIEKLIVDDIKQSKKTIDLPEVISEEELLRVLEVIDNDSKGKRDKLLINLMYETGMKLIEALNLEKDSVNNGVINLKKENKKHIIKISKKLENEFESFFSVDICGEKKVFEGLTRQTFSARVKKYGKKAKLEKSLNPFKLKGSAIYNFIEEGVSIKELKDRLDYTNIGMSGIYLVRNKSDIKKIYDKIAIGDWNVSENI